jgi:hypothetical protein
MMSRAETLAKLRAIAETTDELAKAHVERVSHRLYDSVLHHFGSIDAARKVVGARPPTPSNKRWTKDVVIEELRKAHRRRIRLTNQGLKAAGLRGLTNAAREYCGGLARARQLAKLPDPPPTIIERLVWDEDAIISEIRAHHRLGESLAATRTPAKLVRAAVYRFGSWRGAIEVAGFDYDRVRLVRAPYKRGELLTILRNIAAEAPETTLAELHKHQAVEAWKREFGSIEDAARAAGLRDWPTRLLSPLLSADEVTAALRKRHRNGRALYSSAALDEDRRLHNSALRHFGSWADALRASGLPEAAIRAPIWSSEHWTREEVLGALRARKRSGQSMSPSALRRDDESLYAAAKAHLGYNAEMAIREWGAPRLVTKWTKRAVIAALRENPDQGARPALSLAAQKLFGSVGAAREAARLRPLRTEWSEQRVIDEIRALKPGVRDATLISQAQNRFGSWRAALAAAGVPAKTAPRWTKESIVAALRARVAQSLPIDQTNLRKQDQSLFDGIRNRYGNVGTAVPRLLARQARDHTRYQAYKRRQR